MFTALADCFLHSTCSTGLQRCHESCSVETKQQQNLLTLNTPPPALQGPSWQKSVNVGSTHLEKRGLDISSTHDGGKQNTKVGGTLQANHVQQPWNVYSQAYMKAARNSIVTWIKMGKAFWAFAFLMRWQNDTVETPSTATILFFLRFSYCPSGKMTWRINHDSLMQSWNLAPFDLLPKSKFFSSL